MARPFGWRFKLIDQVLPDRRGPLVVSEIFTLATGRRRATVLFNAVLAMAWFWHHGRVSLAAGGPGENVMISKRLLACAFVGLMVGSAFVGSARAATNLVTDPGFESCPGGRGAADPPGWTVGDGAICDPNPHSGNWDVNLDDGLGTSVSQSIPTIIGDQYDFSFWLSAPEANNSFTASFDGNQVFSDTADISNYTFEDFTVTASGISTVISFNGTSSGGAGWFVDDVSLTDLGPASTDVPEPASMALLGAGLAGLGLVRRRRGGAGAN